MISGDKNRPFRKPRPGKSKRVMAMPAGTASKVAKVADARASQRLFQNDCMKSGWANTARNQRSENSVVGKVSVFSGVNATTQTTSKGASMKRMTRALNARARGPFLRIVITLVIFCSGLQPPGCSSA